MREQLRLDVGGSTPREEWRERYRRVVEYFEATEDLHEFESGGRYPDEADPYVLHADCRAPLRPDSEREYTWHLLLNPWLSPALREAFIVDGSPLTPEHTAHGAGPDDDVASADELVDVHAGRLVVCVALTKVAGIHARGETWIHCDPEIEAQFDTVLDELEAPISEEEVTS
jgi:hypothetical protein